MEQLNIILGRSGVGKTSDFLRKIKETRGEYRHIILAPDQQTHELERKLCEFCGNSISMDAEVLTFSRLCQHIFFYCGGLEDPELDSVGRMILLHRAVTESQNHLNVLSKYTQHPSFFDKLMKTVDELKTNQVATQTLFDLDESVVQKKKIEEIALICSLYDCYTQGLSVNQRENIAKALNVSVDILPDGEVTFDPRDRLTRMAEKLKNSDWGQGKIFWVDGFSDFTPQQLKVLEHLMFQGAFMSVNLLGDVEENDLEDQVRSKDYSQNLFATSLLTMQQLIEKAEKQGLSWNVSQLKEEVQLRPPTLTHMERYLFSHDKIEFPEENLEGITIHSALTMRGEVEWVASEILNLVQYQNHRFKDILVVARDFSSYRNLITSIFPRYKIPVFATEMVSILDKPVVSVVNSVFQAILSAYRYEDFFRYLKTGFSSLTMDEVDLLEEYALFWKIRGKDWVQPFTKHPKGYDKNITEDDIVLLDRLNILREKAITPLLRLQGEAGIGTAEEFCHRLYDFLCEISLYDKIVARQEALELEGDMLQRDEYDQLWDIVCHCLDQCHDLSAKRQMDFAEFSKIFILALGQCSVGTIPVSLDQVTSGETTRLKNMRRKTVFWLGAEEKVVPMPTESGGLFTDFDRAILGARDISLNQDAMALFQREMTTAYEICALATVSFYLSWPSRTTSSLGKPCFLVEDLKKLFPQIRINQEESYEGSFRMMAPIPALEHTERYPFVKELLQRKYPLELALIEESKQWHRGELNDISKNLLYGAKVSFSATRLSSFMGCQFSHFMKYGLHLKARETAEFSALDAGNFIHAVLEDTMKQLENRRNPLTPDEIERFIDEVDKVGGCADLYLKNSLSQRTHREMHFMNRLQKEVKKVLKSALEELNKGLFSFLRGEAYFRCSQEELSLTPSSDKIAISYVGSIDRVDGAVIQNDPQSEVDGLYYRVVDYKSGKNTSISVADVYYGRNLQLPLYFLVAEHWGKALFSEMNLSEDEKELPVFGGAMNLFPSRDEVVSATAKMDEKKIQAEREKTLRRNGIYRKHEDILMAMEEIDYISGEKFQYLPLKVEKSGEISGDGLLEQVEMDLLFAEVRDLLSEIPKTLDTGSIVANPYQELDPKKNACRYCSYQEACFFEEGHRGEQYRLQYLKEESEIFHRLRQKYQEKTGIPLVTEDNFEE